MIPMTPSGTRTRAMWRPLGRVQRAGVVPIGSGNAAISSSPLAIAATRWGSRASRSIIAPPSWARFAAATSAWLAARMPAASARMASAAAPSAVALAALSASASVAAAALAASPMARISRSMSPAGLTRSRAVAIVPPSDGRSRPSTSSGPGFRAKRLRMLSLSKHEPAALRQHQIVAMDHLVAATIAEQPLDFTALVPEDGAGVGAGIGRQAARHLAAVAIKHQHRVAAIELALDRLDAGRQQALAGLERGQRAGVDAERADRLEAAGDPGLAGGQRPGQGQ